MKKLMKLDFELIGHSYLNLKDLSSFYFRLFLIIIAHIISAFYSNNVESTVFYVVIELQSINLTVSPDSVVCLMTYETHRFK